MIRLSAEVSIIKGDEVTLPDEFVAVSRGGEKVLVRLDPDGFNFDSLQEFMEDALDVLYMDGFEDDPRWMYLELTALELEDEPFEGANLGTATVHGEVKAFNGRSEDSRYFKADIDCSAFLSAYRAVAQAEDVLVMPLPALGRDARVVFRPQGESDGLNPPGYYALTRRRSVLLLAARRQTPVLEARALKRLSTLVKEGVITN